MRKNEEQQYIIDVVFFFATWNIMDRSKNS